MAVTQKRSPRRDTLNLRVKPGLRGLIDQAARTVGKSRTDFVLEAAQRAAEETLLERALIRMSLADFERFQAALDDPGPPRPQLREALLRPAPWEK